MSSLDPRVRKDDKQECHLERNEVKSGDLLKLMKKGSLHPRCGGVGMTNSFLVIPVKTGIHVFLDLESSSE